MIAPLRRSISAQLNQPSAVTLTSLAGSTLARSNGGGVGERVGSGAGMGSGSCAPLDRAMDVPHASSPPPPATRPMAPARRARREDMRGLPAFGGQRQSAA